jgi:hypothetical protein
MSNNDLISSTYKDMDYDKAVSHRVHTRMFEILGYLDIIDKKKLTMEDQVYIERVKDICKVMINELHEIMDYFRKSITDRE